MDATGEELLGDTSQLVTYFMAHTCDNKTYVISDKVNTITNLFVVMKYNNIQMQFFQDGADLGGRCGPSAPKIKGKEAICNPDDKNFHCCSPSGWCGGTDEFCKCDGCVDHSKTED